MKDRLDQQKPGLPWKLAWYDGFEAEKQARDFEHYLKSGSGKAFAYYTACYNK